MRTQETCVPKPMKILFTRKAQKQDISQWLIPKGRAKKQTLWFLTKLKKKYFNKSILNVSEDTHTF